MKPLNHSLVDRYVEEVGSYLPRRLQQEVAQQLRPELQQQLAQRIADGDSPQAAEVALLRELGPPHLLAESYSPESRILFGPRLYPAFLRTMKIAIALLIGLAALGLALDLIDAQSLTDVGRALAAAFKSVLAGSLAILGIAVAVFMAIYRATEARPAAKEDWDPRSLPAADDPDKIALGDRVASIAFLVVALVVLNVFRERIGVPLSIDGERGWIPFLGPAFAAQLWLLNTCLVLDLAVNFFVLLRWRWSTGLRWAGFAVNALYVVWLWQLASGPSIIAADPALLADSGWSEEAVAKHQRIVSGPLARVVALNLRLGFFAAVVGLAIQLVKLLRRLFTKGR